MKQDVNSGKREERYMLTKQEIIEFLENNGIKHDDKIVVHASLRSVGAIEDGADGLIDAMC